MGSMKETSNSNIGSIITMLIDDQNVNIDDILTEEQFRQDCQNEPKIKEEIDIHLVDYGSSYQDYAYNGSSGSNTSTTWSSSGSGLHSNHQVKINSKAILQIKI